MKKSYANQDTVRLYKTSIRVVLTVVIAMFCFIGHTEAQDCYNKNRSNGVTAMRSKDYDKAIQWFEVAKKCPDKPENNDLQSKIDECKELKRQASQAAEEKKKHEEKERKEATKKDGKDNNRKDVKDIKKNEAARRLSEGLVAYYPFNGNADDMSGNDNNGRIEGATFTGGQTGQCAHFGGYDNSQIIKIPNSNSLQFTNAASFSFWFKLESSVGMDGWGNKMNNGHMIFFAKNFDRGQAGAGISMIDGNSFRVDVFNDRDGCDATISGNPINSWYHAVMVITDSYFKIYINGNEVATKYKNMNFNASNSCDLILGRLAQRWYPLHGCLDEFRVYNRLLTDEEIKMLSSGRYDNMVVSAPKKTVSNTPTLNTPSITNGLVAYYSFDGNANDLSGNNNSGRIEGATFTGGRSGQCARFGGYDNSQIIKIPNSNSLKFTNAACFSFWFKLESSIGMDGWGRKTNNGRMIFFAKNFDRGQVGAGISMIDGNSFKVDVFNDRDGCEATINGNPINMWHHAVMVVTDSYFKIYINGNKVAMKYKNMNFNASNSCDLILGRLAQQWYPLHGCLDEFCVYNRLLSDEEIKTLYRGY